MSTSTPQAAVLAPARPVAVRRVVVKHHALVRLAHWLNVPILFALIATGLSIYWASPVFEHAPNTATGSRDFLADAGFWVARHFPGLAGNGTGNAGTWLYDRFGIGVYRLAQALRLHWFFAYLFMATGVLYAIGLIAGGGYKALLPRTSDARDALAMIRYYVGLVPAKLLRRPWPHPPMRSKYNALQRGAELIDIALRQTIQIQIGKGHGPIGCGLEAERILAQYVTARRGNRLIGDPLSSQCSQRLQGDFNRRSGAGGLGERADGKLPRHAAAPKARGH